MTTITTEQARTRFTTLPPALQDAVFSEQTAEIIASTLEKFNISEERGENIPVLVGWVLLGFLHAEDLADEIGASAGVPKPLAKEIAESLSNKIFEPLRGALAQFHAPVPEATTNMGATPIHIDIEGTAEAPKIISGTTFTAVPGSRKNVIIGPKIAAAVEQPRDKATTSDIKPLTGDIGKPIPHFEPKSNFGGAMAAQTAPVKKPGSAGEFARLAQGGSTPTPVVKPLVPVAPTPTTKPPTATKETWIPGQARDDKNIMPTPSTPKPMMLQNTSFPKPIQNAPSLNNPQKATDILAGKKMSVPLPMKPTVIEIGGGRSKTGEGTGVMGYGTNEPKQTQLNTPQPMRPATPQPGRQITEITSGNFGSSLPTQGSGQIHRDEKNIAPPSTPKPMNMPIEPVKPLEQITSTKAPAAAESMAGRQSASVPPIKPIGLTPIKITPITPVQPTPQAPQIKSQPAAMPGMTQQTLMPKPGEKVIVKDFKEGETDLRAKP